MKKKSEKRDEAEARNAKYSKLTLQQKLNIQESFNGKQYKKLLVLKAKEAK